MRIRPWYNPRPNTLPGFDIRNVGVSTVPELQEMLAPKGAEILSKRYSKSTIYSAGPGDRKNRV